MWDNHSLRPLFSSPSFLAPSVRTFGRRKAGLDLRLDVLQARLVEAGGELRGLLLRDVLRRGQHDLLLGGHLAQRLRREALDVLLEALVLLLLLEV